MSKKGSTEGPNSDVNLRFGCKLFSLSKNIPVKNPIKYTKDRPIIDIA